MTRSGTKAVVIAALALPACDSTLFSPPARPLPLETAATLPAGDTGVQLEGGLHAGPFRPKLFSGTLRVRHGLDDDLDLSLETSVIHIDVDRVPTGGLRNIYSSRAGIKYRVLKHWAVLGGVGGGYSAGGAFASPDLGTVLAYENRYVVPFLSGRAGVSHPIAPRKVDVSEPTDPPGTRFSEPLPTWFLATSAGARVPLGWATPEAGKLRGSLIAGVGLIRLMDVRQADLFFQGSLGGEIVF